MLWNGLGMEAPKKHKKKKTHKEHKVKLIGDAFVQLDKDQAILTDADQNRRRRTLELTKRNNSWGFTLQTLTYGIRNKKSSEVEVMTYVDYVEMDSSAWFAGLRRGDVILAVDGESVDHMTHRQLVDRLRRCQQTMRLIVLFEDCHRKVELHDRLIKLKTILKGKLQELKDLGEKERQLLTKLPGFSRLDALRVSACSSVSSAESTSSWDKYSMVYPASASGQTNTSVSSMSDEQDGLTDSLSMASSAYSEEGRLSMDGSIVASSDNLESESDNFSDSVFLPSNNRSSVIFKPKFSLPPSDPDNEIIDRIITKADSTSDISQTSLQVSDNLETQNNSKQMSALNQSEGSCSLNDSQSEIGIHNLTVSDDLSKEKVSNSKLLDQSDLSSDTSSLDSHMVDSAISKMADKTENKTENVESAKKNNSSKDRHRKQLNSASSRRSIPECMINESDEITKL